MKMVRSLLLGTAAGFVALSGAQAADLSVKAKPVQYVKIASLYGAGYFYVPGGHTDTIVVGKNMIPNEPLNMAVLRTTRVHDWNLRDYADLNKARSPARYRGNIMGGIGLSG